MREKLIELLWEYDQMRMMRMSIEECVDKLIAHGVTIQTEAENPKTNGDRIRAMTDEELVEHFWEEMDDDKFCTGICPDQKNDCDVCRLRWLKQPAED